MLKKQATIMATTTCDDCGGKLSLDANACPHCGKPARATRSTSVAGLDAVIVVIALVAGLYFGIKAFDHWDSRPAGLIVAGIPIAAAFAWSNRPRR